MKNEFVVDIDRAVAVAIYSCSRTHKYHLLNIHILLITLHSTRCALHCSDGTRSWAVEQVVLLKGLMMF